MIENELKYSQILIRNKELQGSLDSEPYKIKILSNSTINLIKEILEYKLRKGGINANATIGNYDNIVQDSEDCDQYNAVIIFWDLFNVIEDFHYKVELLDESSVDEIFNRIQYEFEIISKNLRTKSLVIMNKFNSFPFSSFQIKDSVLENLAAKLNDYLDKSSPSNFQFINSEKIVSRLGFDKSFDMRYFYSSRSLYTIEFFKSYVEFIKPTMYSAMGKSKKALILDCDNTLWNGILGEDGFDSIEMSSETKEGAIFSEVQSLILSLNAKGILLGLCSKNNEQDVNEVLESHPDMKLKEEHITINKSNWNDKVTNLVEISEELNIGLDSIVFIDDSPFEINLIKERLPEVLVLQRPENLYDYPKMIRDNMDVFYNLSFTEEDKKKIKMYKQQVKRKSSQRTYLDIDSYLESLELSVTIFVDKPDIIPRMSQMTQKTNQFNLTTKRYTESDITNFVSSSKHLVYSFSVLDKYGDSGLTGLCIVYSDDKFKSAHIDTFLMSCRIIGRNLEFAFMDYLIGDLKNRRVNLIHSSFLPTPKNKQVSNFYDNCSFKLSNQNNSIKEYELDINDYKSSKIGYIEILNG